MALLEIRIYEDNWEKRIKITLKNIFLFKREIRRQ